MKQCPKCKLFLPLDQFNLAKTRKSGRQPRCKACRSEAWELSKQTPQYKLRLEKMKVAGKKSQLALRRQVLGVYSNGTFTCNCPGCNTNTYEFLALDHANGGGHKHRHSGSIGKGNLNVYSWLKKNNFPEGFQVLCHNCNLAKAFYGRCPHEVQ